MLITDQSTASIRPIETQDDMDETRLEAVGYVFHGVIPGPDCDPNAARRAPKVGTNILHFARCSKLEKAGASESKVWFRTIGIAKKHLDATIGTNHWKWCKVCIKEITQKVINEQ